MYGIIDKLTGRWYTEPELLNEEGVACMGCSGRRCFLLPGCCDASCLPTSAGGSHCTLPVIILWNASCMSPQVW